MNRLFTFLLVVPVIFLSGCAKSLSNGELNFAESDSNTLSKVECSAIVKITPKDELVTNREYTRSYMFSSTGRAPQKYDDGNVVCTYMITDYTD